MRARLLSSFGLAMILLTACGTSPDRVGQDDSFFTEEGGVDAGEGGLDGDASDAGAEVASFTLADATVKPKLRFSVDGAAAVDAYEPSWTMLLSGSDRRFRLQGATPVKGGKPAFYVEFGRGAALIEAGTYDCARKEAIALIVDSDDSKKMTVVDGGESRACEVVVDAVEEVPPSAVGVASRSTRKAVGHVSATVGNRADAAAPTKSVRATFAVMVVEQ